MDLHPAAAALKAPRPPAPRPQAAKDPHASPSTASSALARRLGHMALTVAPGLASPGSTATTNTATPGVLSPASGPRGSWPVPLQGSGSLSSHRLPAAASAGAPPASPADLAAAALPPWARGLLQPAADGPPGAALSGGDGCCWPAFEVAEGARERVAWLAVEPLAPHSLLRWTAVELDCTLPPAPATPPSSAARGGAGARGAGPGRLWLGVGAHPDAAGGGGGGGGSARMDSAASSLLSSGGSALRVCTATGAPGR